MGKSKGTYIIATVSFIVILVVIYFLFIFQKSQEGPELETTSSEIRQAQEVELSQRPFVTLTPTSDGAEVIISIENMGSFDSIEYELIYQADNPTIPGTKIQRGATGTDINTKDPKYKKSILLGTASRGVRSPDRGVTDGKLTLHLFDGEIEFQSETPWELKLLGSTASVIEDATGNFKLNIPALGKDYWLILADTVGVPPDAKFSQEDVILPIYGVFSIAPPLKTPAKLKLKVGEKIDSLSLYSYNNKDSSWIKSSSDYNSSTREITASVSDFATFVPVSQ